MKQIIIVFLLLAALLVVFAGVTMAQDEPTIRFNPEEMDPLFCEADYTTDVIATNLTPNNLNAADRTEINGFSVEVTYDPALLDVSIASNPFSATEVCSSGSGSCAVGPYVSQNGGLSEEEVLVSFLITGGEQISTGTQAGVAFSANTYLIASLGLAQTGGPLEISDDSIPTQLGNSLTFTCNVTAIGGPLNLQGDTPVAKSGTYLLAIAALLGISGLVLAFRLRQKAN